MSEAAIEGQLQVSGGIGQALLATLDTLAGRVLGQQPVDSKGNPTGQVLYMQMSTGLPIDPTTYANPWTPAGGDTMASITGKYQAPNASSSTTSAASGASGGTASSAPQLNSHLQASIEAAFQTSLLVDGSAAGRTAYRVRSCRGRRGAFGSPAKSVPGRCEGAHQRIQFAVGADVLAVEGAAGRGGQSHREARQIWCRGVIPVGLGEVGELVHDADDAAVGGFAEAVVAHLLQFCADDRLWGSVRGEHRGGLLRESGQQGRCGGERHQHW